MALRDLISYQRAFTLAMEVFESSRRFPKEEKYSLTDQIRRSSRSVCANLGEAYRKRRYPKHFISKLSDADSENSETQVWLDFALACNYLEKETWQDLNKKSQAVGKLLNFMMHNPDKFK